MGLRPTNCGTSSQTVRTVQYLYNWQGNITNESDGAAGGITYSRSLAGEVTQIVNLSYSLTGGAGPVTLVSNVVNGPSGPLSWNLANGLTGVAQYDSLGRVAGGWVCQGSSQAGCSGGTEIYGDTASWNGSNLAGGSDTVLNQSYTYGYDNFNRLISKTVTQGSGATSTTSTIAGATGGSRTATVRSRS